MEEQTPVPGNSAGKSARLSDLCLVGGLLLLGLALMACLFLMDDTRDLPHVEAYKEKHNSEEQVTILYVNGYRILVQEAAVSYAVQLWENGPDGPRLSQCPRTPKKPDADRDTARTTAP